MDWIDSIDHHHLSNMDMIEDNTGLPFIRNSDGYYEWTFYDVCFSSGKVFQNFRLTFDMMYKGLMRKIDESESHIYQASHSFIEMRVPFFVNEFLTDPIKMDYIALLSTSREILQIFLKGIRIASSSISSEENIYYF